MVVTFFPPSEGSRLLCLSTQSLRDFSISDQNLSSAFEDLDVVGPFSAGMTMTRDGSVYFSYI